MKTLMATLVLGSATLCVTTHAVAAEPIGDAQPISRTISLRDLDLAEPSHLPILYARVQETAAAVCDAAVRSERRLHRRAPVGWRARCVQDAVDRAVDSMQDQRLTALHNRNSELLARQR